MSDSKRGFAVVQSAEQSANAHWSPPSPVEVRLAALELALKRWRTGAILLAVLLLVGLAACGVWLVREHRRAAEAREVQRVREDRERNERVERETNQKIQALYRGDDELRKRQGLPPR